MSLNITLIGTGNIGSAMVKGWCKKIESGEALVDLAVKKVDG